MTLISLLRLCCVNSFRHPVDKERGTAWKGQPTRAEQLTKQSIKLTAYIFPETNHLIFSPILRTLFIIQGVSSENNRFMEVTV